MKLTMISPFLLILLGQLSVNAETNLSLRTYLKDIVMREDYPYKAKDITEYIQQAGIDRRQVAHELETMLGENLEADVLESERYVLSKMVIDTLGTFGDSLSLPILATASKAKDRNRRIGAISAYVKVAQEDSLDFAIEIVGNTNQFGMMERRILYEHLANYAQKADDPILDTKREAVRQFLMDSMQTEPSPDAAKKLDELLCSISPDYIESLQRLSALERFQNETTPVFQEYFNRVLNEVRKVLLPAQVTLKPEALEVSPGVLTAFVRLPEGYPVSGITSAICDYASAERMMLNADESEMIMKFRRQDIEKALAQIRQVLDAQFVVRGVWRGATGTNLFEGTASIKKILGEKSK